MPHVSITRLLTGVAIRGEMHKLLTAQLKFCALVRAQVSLSLFFFLFKVSLTINKE